jgi:preprotein translocase subunit SecD
MKKIIQKMALFSVVCCLASACSRNVETGVHSSKPQFTIASKDLTGFAVVITNGTSTDTNKPYIVHLRFNNAKTEDFRKFTHEYINQQVQLLVDTNVVEEPLIVAEIPNGQFDLKFSSPSEANAVANLLAKTFYANYGYNKLDPRGPAIIHVGP